MFIYILLSSKGYDALGLYHHRCINEHIGSAFLGQVMDERPEPTISNTARSWMKGLNPQFLTPFSIVH